MTRQESKVIFFCEPVPFYKFPAKENTDTQPGYHQRFNRIYSVLEQNPDSVQNFYFMGNMLEGEKADAFINDVNYSAPFASKVAKQIFETLKTDLQ